MLSVSKHVVENDMTFFMKERIIHKKETKNENKHFNSNSHGEKISSKERKFIRFICKIE